MAKKKKAGGKKKKEGGAPSAKQAIVAPGPTQLEISLRLELESLEKELLLAKQEAEEAKQKNQFLKSEADSAREETNDYESYMQKKTVREQLKIQNLMDENQKKLDTIAADKLRKTKEFEDIKKGFQEMILEKENELSKILEQIEDLDEFVKKRTQQEETISQLRKEMSELEDEHAQEVSNTKTKFLDEKLKFQREASSAIQKLEREAAMEAQSCIDEHTEKAKCTNKKLRASLISLFQRNKGLLAREQQLRHQNAELKRLLEINDSLKQTTQSTSLAATHSMSHANTTRGRGGVKLPRIDRR
eukprot:m.34069 g.34069  ORF g.34069 m.34069 type:complete len:303 (-) comp9900_c0_seq2:197-1105(-)